MNRLLPAILLVAFLSAHVSAQIRVTEPLCDYRTHPINVDIPNPALSWVLESPRRNTMQTAYRILVADDSLLLKKNTGNVWDSKKVISGQSIQIPYDGKKLAPTHLYFWKVMVWDNHHNISAWSHITSWRMSLLSSPPEWKGTKWIAYEKLPDSLRIVPELGDPGDKRWNEGKDILPIIRKSFFIRKLVTKATVYISGLGQFDLSINGRKVGNDFMDPGWTFYDKQALYLTFDVTPLVKNGDNAIGVMLGNGFYFIPGERYRKIRGAFGYPKMICRLMLEYNDGTSENIISDQTWKAAPGPVTFSSIYGGEDYDAKLEQKGWNEPGFDDTHWKNAILVGGTSNLQAQTEEPLKIFNRFTPHKITQPKPGTWIYDMGQNASAIPEITVEGKKGSVIKITPAELLTKDGLADQSAVGTPVYFNYMLKGAGKETWHPQFMYYGFRYIQVEGGTPVNEKNSDGTPKIIAVKSLHTRNSAKTIGNFQCSNKLFNRIFKLIDWAIKSNTVSIFTDCPHREKLGWLEESYLVGNSIHYNYDIATLCRKVVKDMTYSQTEEGLIPDIAPEFVKFEDGFRDSPEWGSSGVIIPYDMYQWYGDKQVLRDNYDLMTRYVNYLGQKAQGNILYFGLGDWYDIGPNDPGESQLTPAGITATAIYYCDLNILAKTAITLGKKADAEIFAKKASIVKKAYNTKFYNEQTGQYGTGSQTANAVSVYMGLVDPVNKEKVLANLVKDIREHHNEITAGDIGYRFLLKVLDDNGYSQVIYDMNSRTDVPGYGMQLTKGATALTESWQGNRNASNNHFMLGHLMEWLYSGLAGIRPDTNSTAFQQIIIRPEVVGNITSCKASYLSPYGKISNEWKKTASEFKMKTTIPVNTSTVIYLPATPKSVIREGGKPITNRGDLKILRYEQGKVLIKSGSGTYNFTVN